MINHKLDEIVITETIQQAVNRYNIPGGWTRDEPCVSSFKDEIKGKLIANQNGKCAYCGLPLSSRNPEIDHIAPKGGSKRPYHLLHCDRAHPVNAQYYLRVHLEF